MSTFAVTFDDGTHAMVPQTNLQAALKDGGKLAQHMIFDDGTRGLIPLDRVHDAMKDGGSIIGETPGIMGSLPNVQPQEHDLFGPIPGGKAGPKEALEGMATGIGQISAPGIAASLLHKFLPNIQLPHAKGYESTPAKQLPGQIIIQGLMGMEGGLLEPNKAPVAAGARLTIPKPPESLSLSPEQATKYTAALDEANKSFNEKAGTYHSKLSEAFDEAKRSHLEAQAEHGQTLADIQKSHADAIAKAQADFESATQKESAARLAHEQKVEASRASREQSAAIDQQRQQIIETQQAMAEDTRQRAQAVYKENRTALDQQWNEMRVGRQDAQGNIIKPGISEVPSPIDDTVTALNKAETDILRGTKGSIASFRALVKELGLEELTGVADDVEAGTARPGKWYQVNPEQPTAPWQTLRAHASSIGRAMASGDLGNLYPALKLVRDALERTSARIAGENGWGAEYKATHSLEAQFRKDFEDLGPISLGKGNPAARLVRAPNATFASDIIHGKGSDLLEQALSRWDKSGELPTNIQQMRGMASELKNLPKVKVLPEPPAYTGTKPTVQAIPAPETPARPSIPERKLPTSPELPEVMRPTPKPPAPPQPGFLARHVPRVVGKAIGGAIGAKLGHPLIGYSVGGEVGAEVGRKLTIPRTPEEYTRQLVSIPRTSAERTATMEAAKRGEISPDEANRRIARGGGSVRVLRQPSKREE